VSSSEVSKASEDADVIQCHSITCQLPKWKRPWIHAQSIDDWIWLFNNRAYHTAGHGCLLQ